MQDIPMSGNSRLTKIFKGLANNTQIKIDVKCPLIYMEALDESGYKSLEKINVDYKVEQILSKLTIDNPLDLTKQLINLLKENNFCRPTYVSKRSVKRKTMTKPRLV